MTEITGYRKLSEDDKKIINGVKAVAEQVGFMCDSLEKLPEVDPRWLAIARIDLQKGFMAAVRSVAKPESF